MFTDPRGSPAGPRGDEPATASRRCIIRGNLTESRELTARYQDDDFEPYGTDPEVAASDYREMFPYGDYHPMIEAHTVPAPAPRNVHCRNRSRSD